MLRFSIWLFCLIASAQVILNVPLVGKKPDCGLVMNKSTDKVEYNLVNASAICNWTIKPENHSSEIFILLEKLVIDDDDNVTISTVPVNGSSEIIFGPFNAQPDAVLLVTGEIELFIEIRTSPRKVRREFAAVYQAQSCMFVVDDDIATVTQPIYAANTSAMVPCIYNYNIKNEPNVTFAFSFDSFNLSKTSSLEVKGAAEPSSARMQGSDIPPDFLSKEGQVQVTVTMDPKTPSDRFVLRRHKTYSGCSGFIPVNGRETKHSPPLPKLIDQDVIMECHWHIQNDNPNQALGLKFNTLDLKSIFDIVTITDGSRTTLLPFLQVSRSTQSDSLVQEMRTSSPDLLIVFKPDSFASQISFDVFGAGSGKYMKDNGTFKATSNPSGVNDTIFLLEVAPDKNVVLNFNDFSLSDPTSLAFYEGFSLKSRKIATLRSGAWYPIISSTSKLMIAAIAYSKGEFEAKFQAAAEGCMHMSPGDSDSYVLSGNCNSTCSWIIPPTDYKGSLLLNLQYLALEKDDMITVLRLDKNKTVVAIITSNSTHVPQFSLDTTVGAFVNVSRGACPKKENIVLVGRADYLPDCSQKYTLSPYDTLQVTSPGYPNTYPLLSHCNTSIAQPSKDQILHLSFDELDLAPNHCIQISYVTDKGSSSFQITGNQMPDDFILAGDVAILFNSGSCNTTKGVTTYASRQGFLLNLNATTCGGVLTDKDKKLRIPANTTLCIYKVSVSASERDGSANYIIYDAEEGKGGNYELVVHDGPSVRDNVIKNNTHKDIWSRTNSLIFVYRRSDSTKPSAEVNISYLTKSCDKSSQCDNGLCIHPDWRCDGKNDCGDYSDEKNCQSTPPIPATVAGISSVTFGICIILFFAVGIAVTLCTPWALEKYRNRYHQFRDLSVIE